MTAKMVVEFALLSAAAFCGLSLLLKAIHFLQAALRLPF